MNQIKSIIKPKHLYYIIIISINLIKKLRSPCIHHICVFKAIYVLYLWYIKISIKIINVFFTLSLLTIYSILFQTINRRKFLFPVSLMGGPILTSPTCSLSFPCTHKPRSEATSWTICCWESNMSSVWKVQEGGTKHLKHMYKVSTQRTKGYRKYAICILTMMRWSPIHTSGIWMFLHVGHLI